MKRLNVILLFIGLVLLAQPEPVPSVLAQTEPRFSYPGARRFRLTSYFDHFNPNYTVDGALTIYTTERGRQDHGCADCYWSGGIQVCGYHTEPNCGGRRIYYDGHPAIDYAFPLNTPIAAAAPGVALQRDILGFAVVIDHGGGYWSKYGYVNRDSRIPHNDWRLSRRAAQARNRRPISQPQAQPPPQAGAIARSAPAAPPSPHLRPADRRSLSALRL